MIYLHLFVTFFQIGLFTIGGGYAMIPMIQDEVVKNGWLTMGELVDFIAVGESTPGPFAVNIATYIGSVTGGFFGALCATVGVVLPSFLIILLIAKWFTAFGDNRLVRGALTGLRPAVVGLIAAAAFSIACSNLISLEHVAGPADLPNSINRIGLLVFVPLLIFTLKKKPHPILLILISAGAGIALCCLRDLLI
ncbi:chromate transporter [Clostridiaceae bacterium NSJ-31]|uniref:Chromate transporter n=1 Tax=Ligaoa zhengdingensis TaxID=2763658 RepID=A0A926DX71_9FIRM|nr:chromate transporter [Ligaoa zhengdingensis]MBC8545502.1 chromate transporter [Ligaoa zhengdingensis]